MSMVSLFMTSLSRKAIKILYGFSNRDPKTLGVYMKTRSLDVDGCCRPLTYVFFACFIGVKGKDMESQNKSIWGRERERE